MSGSSRPVLQFLPEGTRTGWAALLIACTGSGPHGGQQPPPPASGRDAPVERVAPHPAPGGPDAVPKPGGRLAGICEASAVVAREGGFWVGDNEGETHLYAFSPALESAGTVPLGAEIEDLEALASLPVGLLAVGSQGANKRGERRPARERVLLLGHKPHRPDLSDCSPCEAARSLPPKEGGLSVEGAAWWREKLWFGLRSPLLGGRAIVLEMAGDPARDLRVAHQHTLDLGGFGVRAMLAEDDRLLLLAGPAGRGDDPHRLYALSAPGDDPRQLSPERLPADLPPASEGIAPLAGGDYLVVTDGDGEPGGPCEDPALWYRISPPEPGEGSRGP